MRKLLKKYPVCAWRGVMLIAPNFNVRHGRGRSTSTRTSTRTRPFAERRCCLVTNGERRSRGQRVNTKPFHIDAVDVKKVDLSVKISLSTSILTWEPINNVKKMVQSIPDVNPHDVNVKTASEFRRRVQDLAKENPTTEEGSTAKFCEESGVRERVSLGALQGAPLNATMDAPRNKSGSTWRIRGSPRKHFRTQISDEFLTVFTRV